MLASLLIAATCAVPPAADLKEVNYRIERVSASLKVAIRFPSLAQLPCETEAVSFGQRHQWHIPPHSPIVFSVTDRLGQLVQEVEYSGDLSVKDTPPYLSMNLFDLKANKRLSDHRVLRIDIAGGGTLVPSPAVDVEDQGQRTFLPATLLR